MSTRHAYLPGEKAFFFEVTGTDGLDFIRENGLILQDCALR